MQLPKIVVVGGGAGGLELVSKLGNKLGKKRNAEIHLVDSSPTHLWKPLLHEVATGSLDSGIDELSYREQAHLHHFTFHQGSFCALDRNSRRLTLAPLHDETGDVILPERHLQYDYLVIAIGSRTNDFGTPGAQQHCAFLDTRRQADRFHEHLINTYLRLNSQASAGEDRSLRIAIVGAGATGVELSAELYNMSDLLAVYGISHLKTDSLKISIVEAGERILPALPQRISNAVVRELQALNMDVRTGTLVTEVTEQGLLTDQGELLEADIKVWAAGVKAPDFLAGIGGMETNRVNQLKVEKTLQTTLDDRIFAIGDCAFCVQDDGSPVPPRAQAAHQEASQMYKNLRARLNNKPLQEYVYRDHGSLVSLSRYSTVGSLMGNLTRGSVMVEGKLARIVYISLYRMHQIALHGYFKTFLLALSGRINRVIRPKLKLH